MFEKSLIRRVNKATIAAEENPTKINRNFHRSAMAYCMELMGQGYSKTFDSHQQLRFGKGLRC